MRRQTKSKSINDKKLQNIILIGNRLGSYIANGVTYFSCPICNKLFKQEKLGIKHMKMCKPPLFHTKQNETKIRDPYEIIPEEIELEAQIINNNSIKHNRNGLGSKELIKKFQRHSNDFKSKERKVKCFKKEIIRTVKSQSKINGNHTKDLRYEGNTYARNSKEVIQPNNADIKKKKSNLKSKNEKATLSVNRKTEKKNRGRLSESAIQERLRKISQKLRNHKQKEVPNDDEDEEDQRQAIEEKLSLLNKDSELRIYQGEGDPPEEFKEVNDSIVNMENGHANGKNDNSLVKLEERSMLDSNETIIITQQPDGQLHGCRKCPEVFVNPMDLLRHSRMKHSYPKIMMAPSEVKKLLKVKDRSHCPVCEKPLVPAYKSVYEKHLQTHSWMAEHECSVCKKKFKRRDHMKVHEKRHIV